MTTSEGLRYRFFLEAPFMIDDHGDGIYGVHTERGQLGVIKSSRQPQMSDRLLFINTQYNEGGGLVAIIGCDVEQDGSVKPYQDRILYPFIPEKVERVRKLLKGNVPSKLNPSQLSLT